MTTKYSCSGKELLESMKSLDMLVKSVGEQIAMEESRLTDVSVHYKEITVKSGFAKNKFEEQCPEIVDLMISLEAYKKQLAESKSTALKVIQKLDMKSQSVLMYYYMQNRTIEQTAEFLGKSYTWTIQKIKSAEKEFEKNFNKF
ncbi:MAG: hypothetical protein MJZ37_08015 [Bacilli bacterium]|nr:hypothetical protein [Bacilli bacterium]